MPIVDVVLNAKTIRGSIVGMRKDMEEALMFAEEGKVKSHIATNRLANINQIFDNLRMGLMEDRTVKET